MLCGINSFHLKLDFGPRLPGHFKTFQVFQKSPAPANEAGRGNVTRTAVLMRAVPRAPASAPHSICCGSNAHRRTRRGRFLLLRRKRPYARQDAAKLFAFGGSQGLI